MCILAGSSYPELAQTIASTLGSRFIDRELATFANGERRVWIKDELDGHSITILQTLSQPVDSHLVELLMLVDAADRLGARHINLLIPWMGYSLQDKVFREGEPIAAKVVADLLSHKRVQRIFLLDLHNSSIPGFFSVPTQHLSAMPLFIDHVKATYDLNNCVVTSPDFGGLKRAKQFAEKLKLPLTNIDKHRDLTTGQVSAVELTGDVDGKTVLVFDDVINSGSTVVETAKLLKNQGANSVFFFATHGLFTKGLQPVTEAEIDKVVITNSLPQKETSAKVEVLDASPILASALKSWDN